MLKAWKVVALCLGALVWPVGAWADFSGLYSPDKWAAVVNGTPPGGSVDVSGAPASVTLNGGNEGCDESSPCYIDYTIPAPASGNVSFHWDYQTEDGDGPSYDLFIVLEDGTETQLSDDSGDQNQSGDYSFPVTVGQVFGFRLDCTDCVFGAATVTISDFVGPTATAPVAAVQPVPTLHEWSLIGMAGLMGLFGFFMIGRGRRGARQ